jgi:hypothetical protein
VPIRARYGLFHRDDDGLGANVVLFDLLKAE